MKVLLLALALVLIGFPAYAQTPTVPSNTPFSVVADHSDGTGTPATGFRCYIDGVRVGNDLPLSARVGGKVTCAMPGQPAGGHSAIVAALNGVSIEARSPSLAFTAVTPPPTPPNAPSNLQIILQVAVNPDGSATLTAMRITPQ
jgi:hypothetical protein